MVIENEIFKRRKLNIATLIPYGFVKDDNVYKYSKVFMNNLRADILIDSTGTVSGKVFDMDADDEYIAFRIEKQVGKFVNSVREKYENILIDIAEHCFDKLCFLTDQGNRIAKQIMELYNDEPEFAWAKFPGFGIFKNPNNKKWYGLIVNIDKSKLDKECSGEVEVINVKLDDNKIPELLKKEGFYPAYHMNKKNWISIILDDTLSDHEILGYIAESHKYTESSGEWIVPANPKYYDVITCFDNTDNILWKQANDINCGDKIYIYVGRPYSAILYKCEAVEVNIPYEYKDENLSMNRVMKIKLLERYDRDKYTLTKLNEYGIKGIRCTRSMPKALSKAINKD